MIFDVHQKRLPCLKDNNGSKDPKAIHVDSDAYALPNIHLINICQMSIMRQ